MSSYDDSYEKRMVEAAELAGVPYYVGMYLCFTCEKFQRLDDGKHLPAKCGNCGQSLMEKGSCTVPDGVIRGSGHHGLVYVDGGVHQRYDVMIRDESIRQRLFHAGQGTDRKFFVFVVKNVEIGKPKKITKQKHTEFMPSQITVGNLIRTNLSALLLGWSQLMWNPTNYELLISMEKEIVGLGQNVGIKRVR